jgi:hypothetical protein
MKTSAVASLLFGTLAIAAPLEKRKYVTKTSVVVQTEIVYVTVYDGQAPVVEATSTPGLFYEQPPKKSSSSSTAAAPTSTSTSTKEKEPAYTPPAPAPQPSSTSVYIAPPEPTSVYTPPPAPTTSAYVAPPAPSSTTPAAPAPEPSSPPSGGNAYTGDITVYDTYGGYGACGTLLSDDEFTAAISKDSWGADIWGGADNLNQNPWCGKSATVTYNGQSVTVKILDKCQGCKPGDIDLTRAAWNKLTGGAYGSRFTASWTS